jgi:hypothetical protein
MANINGLIANGGVDVTQMTNEVIVGDGGIVPVKWEACSEECEIVRETPRLVRSIP